MELHKPARQPLPSRRAHTQEFEMFRCTVDQKILPPSDFALSLASQLTFIHIRWYTKEFLYFQWEPRVTKKTKERISNSTNGQVMRVACNQVARLSVNLIKTSETNCCCSQQKMLTSCQLSKMKTLKVMHKHNICVCMYQSKARRKTCFLF